ncbi:MAG: glycogen debranching enzyme GlgX, partial [Rhodoferax sp.]
DVCWFKPDGTEMTPEEWNDGNARCLAMLMSGRGIPDRGARGETLVDDDFLLLFNAHHDTIPFTLPQAKNGAWRLLLDTATDAMPSAPHEAVAFAALTADWADAIYLLQGRSFVLLSSSEKPA